MSRLAVAISIAPVVASALVACGSSSDAAEPSPTVGMASTSASASTSNSASSSSVASASSSTAASSGSSSSSASSSASSASSSSSSSASSGSAGALPSYTVIDLGSDALPATTSFGLGGCLVVSTPPFGSPTAGQYECSALDNESATSLESTMAWVGYQQGASAATDLPIIYASFCCGQPPGWPPDETGGGAADLVLAPGETGGRALAVDLTVSYVVGYVENSGGAKQAAEWSQQGIAVLAALGPGDATAYAVNACGQIVGESGQEDLTPGWLAAIATVWVNGTPQALEHLLVPGSPSLRLTSARWINDAGYIGAIGYASGTDGSDTLNEHEYLLVPSPAQPATCS